MTEIRFSKVRERIRQATRNSIDRWLASCGYSLQPTGRRYIDAATTIGAAERAGVSICEYLESQETDPRKRGRRDRIIRRMEEAGCFQRVEHVTEIGAGTGMYLDRVIERAKPGRYEVYETSADWREFLSSLVRRYATQSKIHVADGETLQSTPDQCSDLVHAHGLFVYLSSIETFAYLAEMARVCRAGGYVVFDCYFDESTTIQTINDWIGSEWRFPVITSQSLAEQFYGELGLVVHQRFTEIHGPAQVNYEILKRTEA